MNDDELVKQAAERHETRMASRLRGNQVWKHKSDPDRYVLIRDAAIGGSLGHAVTYLPVHRDDRPLVVFPWQVQGEERTIAKADFLDEFELYWERGSKDLGASANLNGELARVRELRREGRHEEADAIVSAGTSVHSIVKAAEAARGRRAAGGQDWYDGLAPRVRAAAALLHTRRHELMEEIAVLQVELDNIDLALDDLTKTED